MYIYEKIYLQKFKNISIIINSEAVSKCVRFLVCWIIFPGQEVCVEVGVIVDHDENEHDTGQDVSDDVADNDRDDYLVQAAALLLRAHRH